MRVWTKTFLTDQAEPQARSLDRTFAEHARGMGGYDCVGYDSPEQFFATHFTLSSRFQHYDSFLRRYLPQRGRTLSIASGRAVNELRLGADGYEILCSDLEPVCADRVRALFPFYRFMPWDALNDALPAERFDAVMCLSFAYLLAPASLEAFLGRVRELLRPGGLFILDGAGPPDNVLSNMLHDVVLPIDARLTCAVLNLRARLRGGSRRVVYRKHHGYRYRDEELTAAAVRCGLTPVAVSHADFESEWKRMFLYRYVLSRLSPIRRAMLKGGRLMPYVRMFAFSRTS